MSSLAHFLIFFYLLHASYARHIGMVDKELNGQHIYIFGKDLLQDMEQWTNKGAASPSIRNPYFSNEKEITKGEVTIKSYAQMEFNDAAKMEERKTQVRRTLSGLGSKLQDAKETIDSKENDDGVIEDTVVMDYAQPHRKAPIHNKEP